MKRLNYFVCSVIAIVMAVSCDQDNGPVDYPIVGDFSLYGTSSTGYWTDGEQIGVFVTSDGFMQSNLLYSPVAGEGTTALNASAEKAGFKKGNHSIYAYTPYAEAAAELTSIPVPDYVEQNTAIFDPYADTDFAGMMLQYNSQAAEFQHAMKEVVEKSSAAVNMTFEKSVTLSEVTVMEYGLDGDDVDSKVGKKVTKIVITAEFPIAIENASYDFVENKLTSDSSNSITLGLDEKYVIYKSYFVSGYGFTFKTIADDLLGKTVNIKVYLEDGSVYAADAEIMESYMDDSLMIAGLALTQAE